MRSIASSLPPAPPAARPPPLVPAPVLLLAELELADALADGPLWFVLLTTLKGCVLASSEPLLTRKRKACPLC